MARRGAKRGGPREIRPRNIESPKPARRRLRVYAFDPNASVELETAVINDAVIDLPWDNPWEDPLTLGPSNEYLEVIDYDFPSQTFYEPLDLNDPMLLAQDGLPVSEGRPQFHQQMVFAVAMKTILDFERALGRPVFWSQPESARARSDGEGAPPSGKHDAADKEAYARDRRRYYPDFIKRLRIYPHAMRAANAYYSPAKAALLFGYFKGDPPADGLEEPWVFTALSQDIVAHETTHAILHGMRRRSVEASNEDSLAFHEGFADIVALMQHFTIQRVVEHELGRTGGVLRSVNLLTGLAQQFGRATGRNGALRQALDTLCEEQRAADHAAHAASMGLDREKPQARRLADVMEPHDRGQFLVAAVFDAFVTIYERRSRDLFRIAGVRPGDDLPPGLVSRLAEQAMKAASSVNQMCVRALDYLPPVSATFGEYLRAIMTADFDLYPDDPKKYRVAMAEAFRKRGIPVPGCISYAPDALRWEEPDLSSFDRIFAEERENGEGGHEANRWARDANKLFADALGTMLYNPRYPSPADGKREKRQTKEQERAAELGEESASRRTLQTRFIDYSEYRDPGVLQPNLREESMRVVLHNQRALHAWLAQTDQRRDRVTARRIDRAWEELLGLRLMPMRKGGAETGDWGKGPLSVRCYDEVRIDNDGRKWRMPELYPIDDADDGVHDDWRIPKFDVHSVRISRRRTPEGREIQQLIAQVTQRRWGFFDETMQQEVDENGPVDPENPGYDYDDPDFWFRGGATIVVNLRDGRLSYVIRNRIDNDERLAKQRKFILGDEAALAMAAPGSPMRQEPFCFMHGDQA